MKNGSLSVSAAFLLVFFSFLLGALPSLSTAAGCLNQNILVQASLNGSTSVTQGGRASFTILVTNGDFPQSVDLNAQCNPDEFTCSFDDVPYPNVLAARENRIYHLSVYTTLNTPLGNHAIPIQASIFAPTSCAETGVLNLSVNAGAALPSLSATISPVGTQNTQPGESVTYTISITNNQDNETFARIMQAGNPFESTTSLSASTLTLQPHESKDVTAVVNIPPGTPGNAYAFVFNVRAGAETFEDFSLPARVFVLAPTAVIAIENDTLQTRCLDVNFTQPLDLQLGFRNNGESSGPFSLELQGLADSLKLASINPNYLEITPGDRQFADLRFLPSHDTPLDTHHIALVVKQGQFELQRAEYCFRVVAVSGIRIDKPDLIVIPRGSHTSAFCDITNNGNQQQSVAIDYSPFPSLGLNITPLSYLLAPGSHDTCELQFSTTMQTPLNDYTVPTTFYTSPAGDMIPVNFQVSVVSSNQSGQSFLGISFPESAATPTPAPSPTPLPYGCDYANPPCPTGYRCVNNQCLVVTPAPTSPTASPIPYGCQYHNPDCPTGYVCVNNACVAATPAPTATPTPYGCQYNNPACPTGYVCVNNQCTVSVQPAANAEIIFDASDTMNDQIAGKTKLQTAKDAINYFVDQVTTMRVGLRAFGTQPGLNYNESCLDSKLLAQIQPIDRPALHTIVDSITANGLTPLDYSLQKAKNDLAPYSGTKLAVLVSDGYESCGGDPCLQARSLAANGITVYAIGFNVDAQGAQQLQCVASVTNGKYFDARNADELTAAVNAIFGTGPVLAAPHAPSSALSFDDAGVLHTIVGITDTSISFKVRVSNSNTLAYNDVALDVLDIPASWVSVSAPQSIPAASSRDYTVMLTPHAQAGSNLLLEFYAHSGREGVKVPARFSIVGAERKLSFQTTDKVTQGQQSYSFTATVRNDGNQPLTNVHPLLFASSTQGLQLEATPATVDLQPGETAEIRITIRSAAGAQNPAQDATLRLTSAEGSSTASVIQVPVLNSPQPASEPLSWKVILAVLLLIGIFVLLAKEEPTPPRRIVFHD